MDFRASEQDESPGFQLAPMIDIVFVILIFFVATYAVTREEKLLGLNLPATTSGQPESRQRQQILVNLDKDGGIFIERRQLQPEILERRLRQLAAFAGSEETKPTVIIRADGDCTHRKVIEVMDLCARAGISQVHFSAVQSEK